MPVRCKMSSFKVVALLFVVVTSLKIIGANHLHELKANSAKLERTRHLLNGWSEAYKLDGQLAPTESLGRPGVGGGGSQSQPGWLLRAPHLEDCVEATLRRQLAEEGPGDGTPPKWTEISSGSCTPSPPWVEGGAEANLAKTLEAQAAIWLHQNAAACHDDSGAGSSAARFALAEWPSAAEHTLGQQLHLMGRALSLAMHHARVLVPLPGIFERANHSSCPGGAQGSLGCYFAPLASDECAQAALRLWEAAADKEKATLGATGPEGEALLASDARVVLIRGEAMRGLRGEARAAERWGKPWTEQKPKIRFSSEAMAAAAAALPEEALQASWWMSQAVSYMLRRPTAYTCHLLNRARQQAYGLRAAHDTLTAEAGQQFAAEQCEDGFRDEVYLIRAMEVGDSPLEATLWRDKPPYVYGPLVSIHLSAPQVDGSGSSGVGDSNGSLRVGGDGGVADGSSGSTGPVGGGGNGGGGEVGARGLGAHLMWAETLRFRMPDLKYVWLSTNVEDLMEDAIERRHWIFLHTTVRRRLLSTSFFDYEKAVGVETLTGASFADLLMAARADYFVGTLSSDWCQLINELRLTNGGLKKEYISLSELGQS
eukprot:jgi/Mesen1/5381/ME000268S04582